MDCRVKPGNDTEKMRRERTLTYTTLISMIGSFFSTRA
jgi:hypothetical protein